MSSAIQTASVTVRVVSLRAMLANTRWSMMTARARIMQSSVRRSGVAEVAAGTAVAPEAAEVAEVVIVTAGMIAEMTAGMTAAAGILTAAEVGIMTAGAKAEVFRHQLCSCEALFAAASAL